MYYKINLGKQVHKLAKTMQIKKQQKVANILNIHLSSSVANSKYFKNGNIFAAVYHGLLSTELDEELTRCKKKLYLV